MWNDHHRKTISRYDWHLILMSYWGRTLPASSDYPKLFLFFKNQHVFDQLNHIHLNAIKFNQKEKKEKEKKKEKKGLVSEWNYKRQDRKHVLFRRQVSFFLRLFLWLSLEILWKESMKLPQIIHFLEAEKEETSKNVAGWRKNLVKARLCQQTFREKKNGETSIIAWALPISALSGGKACPCSPSPPFSGGAREHDMAYLTQITALCPTIHFLLGMQVASWDKQPCIQSNSSRKQLHISPPFLPPPLTRRSFQNQKEKTFSRGTKGTDLKDLQEEIPPHTHTHTPLPPSPRNCQA